MSIRAAPASASKITATFVALSPCAPEVPIAGVRPSHERNEAPTAQTPGHQASNCTRQAVPACLHMTASAARMAPVSKITDRLHRAALKQ
jgi:hypothetical protein